MNGLIEFLKGAGHALAVILVLFTACAGALILMLLMFRYAAWILLAALIIVPLLAGWARYKDSTERNDFS